MKACWMNQNRTALCPPKVREQQQKSPINAMLNREHEGSLTPREHHSAFTFYNTPHHLRGDGLVREQQPHHALVQPVVGEYYSSKEQLLAAIKDRLQTLYDAKRISRDEFVAIAKNTYRVLTADSQRSGGGTVANGLESSRISFSTSWNNAALDMALKLQLELLGVMWPPAISSQRSSSSSAAYRRRRSRSNSLNSSIAVPRDTSARARGAASRSSSIYSEDASCLSGRANNDRLQVSSEECMTPLGRLAKQGTRPPSPTEPLLSERDLSLISKHVVRSSAHADSSTAKSLRGREEGSSGLHLERLERLRSHHKQLALEGLLKESAQRIVSAAAGGIILREKYEGSTPKRIVSSSSSASAHVSFPYVVAELEEKESYFRLKLEKLEVEDRTQMQGLCMSRLISLLASNHRTTFYRDEDVKKDNPEDYMYTKVNVNHRMGLAEDRNIGARGGRFDVNTMNSGEDEVEEDDDDADDDEDVPPSEDPPPFRTLTVSATDGTVLSAPPPSYARRSFSGVYSASSSDDLQNRRAGVSSLLPVAKHRAVLNSNTLTPEGLRLLYAAAARQERSAQKSHRNATPPPIRQQLPKTPLRASVGIGGKGAPSAFPLQKVPQPHAFFADPYGAASPRPAAATSSLRTTQTSINVGTPLRRGDTIRNSPQSTATPSRRLGPIIHNQDGKNRKSSGPSPQMTRSVRGVQPSPNSSRRMASPSSSHVKKGTVSGDSTPRGSHYPSREEVVEHVSTLLQPAYNTGLLPAEAFAAVVRHVSSQLTTEGVPAGYRWEDVVSLHVQEGCQQIGLMNLEL